MIESIGHGFKIGGAIVPFKTRTLNKIGETTATEILAYSDTYTQFTGKEFAIPLSEDSLNRTITDKNPTIQNNDNPFANSYNHLRKIFHHRVKETLEKAIQRHGKVLLFPYMTSRGLEDIETIYGNNLIIVSPEILIKEQLAQKAFTYTLMKKKGISVVNGKVVNSTSEACETFQKNLNEWGGEAFVSAISGAGGTGCLHAKSTSDIRNKFQSVEEEQELIVTQWLYNIQAAPNIMYFIDDYKAHVLMVTDQIIENGTEYHGNSYPLNINPHAFENLLLLAEQVGEVMREIGYRGIGGMDAIIADNTPYFVEINPRKNHSSVININLLEQFRPEGMPPLSYLEAMLFTSENQLKFDFSEWKEKFEKQNISYDMYILKKKGWTIFNSKGMVSQPDHSWNKHSQGYFANIPFSEKKQEIIIPKTYASLKSGGHTRTINPTDIIRIVSPNKRDRWKLLKKAMGGIKNL